MTISKEESRQKVAKFLEVYKQHLAEGRFESQKEANTEKYIERLFEDLGWDKLTDLERQHRIKSGEVDYSINLDDKTYFFIEVKKHDEDLNKHKKQALDYAFLAGKKWVILTNLREFIVYNAQYRGQSDDIVRLFRPIQISEINDRFEDLWLLSKQGAEENLLEKRAIDTSKVKITHPITILSKELLEWRSMLTKEMKNHPKLNEVSGKSKEEADEWIDEAVQMLLNRFIFLRTIEDLGNWKFSLRELVNQWKDKKKKSLMETISAFFAEMNTAYNAGLFAPHDCEKLTLADEVLEKVITEMYVKKELDLEWNFEALASDQDILGLAYEQYLGTTLTEKTSRIKENKIKRKKMGIYYTPKYIVEYIVKNALAEKLKKCKTLDDILEIKVLDPACGSGSFLKEAYRTFKDEIKRRKLDSQRYLDKETGEYFSANDAVLRNCIFGVDLDKKACEMAKLNLLILAAMGGTHQLLNIDRNIQQGNSLIDDAELIGFKLAFKWGERFSDIIKNGGFDVIIGNPPYVSVKAIQVNEKEFYTQKYQSAVGQFDLYGLFIEKSISMLKDGGYFSFITSNTYLQNKDFKTLREYILKNTKILKIIDLRETVFVDANLDVAVLVLQKCQSETQRKNTTINIIDEPSKFTKLEFEQISQETYYKQEDFVFLTHHNLEFDKLDKKLKIGTENLGDIVNMTRGIELGSNDCINQVLKPSKEFVPILVGKDIARYVINFSGRWIKFQEGNKSDFKTRETFETQKILIQRIRNLSLKRRLVATLDDSSYYTMNTLRIIHPKKAQYSLRYLLAVINSKMMNYYFLKSFNNKDIYAYQLEKIPIKDISGAEQQPIVNLVDRMLSLNKKLAEFGDKNTPETARLNEEIVKIDAEIDELVYKIYGLSDAEIEIVKESLKQ